jgi:uncharacterized protein YcbK (DUF882 family)
MTWILAPPGQITKHFSWNEADCRCCGRIASREAVQKAARMMEEIRAKLGGHPIKVLSWCRCERHNRNVGGAQNSFHMLGLAVDFVVKGMSAREVQEALSGHEGGLGLYTGFTHADCRTDRQGEPKRARWTE